MSPSPNMQQQGRYRSMQRPQPLAPGQMPQGGPPSFTGGTPSGMQPMNAGMQQNAAQFAAQRRMPAPWQPDASQQPMPPDQPQGISGINPAAPAVAAQNQAAAAQQPNRMPAPWQPPQMGGQQPRPQYQGAPGAGQRSQMSAPQAPANPMSQRQNMQNQQNPRMQ